MSDYDSFLNTKSIQIDAAGFDPAELMAHLFDYQKAVVRWALKKGRACIFAGTGMGKTAMQLEWARQVSDHTGGMVLILCPLAIAHQTEKEARRFGLDAHAVRAQTQDRIQIANYENLHKFQPQDFAGIVLDESSILKSFSGKIRTMIIDSFAATPYKLACTATPAPNDIEEIGNHAEFVGVMKRVEMLSGRPSVLAVRTEESSRGLHRDRRNGLDDSKHKAQRRTSADNAERDDQTHGAGNEKGTRRDYTGKSKIRARHGPVRTLYDAPGGLCGSRSRTP